MTNVIAPLLAAPLFTLCRHSAHHRRPSCPPSAVSLSRVLTPFPPSSRRILVALEISPTRSVFNAEVRGTLSRSKFSLAQSDIHSLALRLSSITCCWRYCYRLFEAAFSFRVLVFFPRSFAFFFFRARGRCCKFMIRTSDEKIALSRGTRAKSRQRDSFSFAEITASHSYARACDTH